MNRILSPTRPAVRQLYVDQSGHYRPSWESLELCEAGVRELRHSMGFRRMNFERYETLLDLQKELHMHKGGEREIAILEELEVLSREIAADKESNEHDLLRLEQSRAGYLASLVKGTSDAVREHWLAQLVELLNRQYERYSVDFEHPDQRTRLLSMRRFQQFSNRIFNLDEQTVAAHPTLRRYAEVNRDIKGKMFWDRDWKA